jgi:hypothetical protein
MYQNTASLVGGILNSALFQKFFKKTLDLFDFV